MQHLTLNPTTSLPAIRDLPANVKPPTSLPEAKEIKVHPSSGEKDTGNASLFFVGTATTILEWEGIRVMTDPNFLHAGDHVHLGPGVVGTRKTNPAIDLHDLPRIDCVLLSHYHADHFDEKVESSLRRSLPIITTPHAKSHLDDSGKPASEAFSDIYALDFFEEMMVDIVAGGDQEVKQGGGDRSAKIKVTGMPGKHVPSGIVGTLNDLVGAVPPTNGWMVELGHGNASIPDDFSCGYRIYISGDTLLVDELHEIPRRYAGQNIDLMLVHLGGTTIPSPAMPLLMVTMDGKMGLELVRLINPELTIPIHYDDYDVFLSPLSDFKKVMDEAGLSDKVVYLDRGDKYKFSVREK